MGTLSVHQTSALFEKKTLLMLPCLTIGRGTIYPVYKNVVDSSTNLTLSGVWVFLLLFFVF